MSATLLEEIVHGAPSGCVEEFFSGVRVVKGDFALFVLSIFYEGGFNDKVTRMLRIVSIVITDTIGCVKVAPPTEVFLDRSFRCAMFLFAHYAFAALDGIVSGFDGPRHGERFV